MDGIPSLLELPTSKMRPTEPSGQAFNVPFVMSAELFRQMKRVAIRLRASPTMLLIAAFQVRSCNHCTSAPGITLLQKKVSKWLKLTRKFE